MCISAMAVFWKKKKILFVFKSNAPVAALLPHRCAITQLSSAIELSVSPHPPLVDTVGLLLFYEYLHNINYFFGQFIFHKLNDK